MDCRSANVDPWVIVAGGVHRHGGTDKANLALIEYLLERQHDVHLITHFVDAELAQHPRLHVTTVPSPASSCFLGEQLLSYWGRRIAAQLRRTASPRVVVNGGNCLAGDINWVHCVHHAWTHRMEAAPTAMRVKQWLATRSARRREAMAITKAKLIVANSDLTQRHLIEHLGIEPNRIHRVYLGAESTWLPPTERERSDARKSFGIVDDSPVVTFAGAVGFDNNKGLDTLLRAWRELHRQSQWNGRLIVAGDGRALQTWKQFVAAEGMQESIQFLGHTQRMPELYAASDVLVSPVTYESYGLNVQEALCRGVPAIVSAQAGVAERYPSELKDLLVNDPRNYVQLASRLLEWRPNLPLWKHKTRLFSDELRRYSWRDMASRFYELATAN